MITCLLFFARLYRAIISCIFYPIFLPRADPLPKLSLGHSIGVSPSFLSVDGPLGTHLLGANAPDHAFRSGYTLALAGASAVSRGGG